MPRTSHTRRWTLLIAGLLVVWVGLIFGTSCTVVRPQEFFAWFHRHVFTDESAYANFQVFWGFSWFAVVKGWHVVEFAILTLLANAALSRLAGRRSTGIILTSMLLCLLFAISDEWHQTFVPDRYGTVTDVLIDGLGILLAGGWLLRRLRRAQPQVGARSLGK
jgi:hypothetical protein